MLRFRIFCLSILYLKMLKLKLYETIILPLVLCGFEILSVALNKDID